MAELSTLNPALNSIHNIETIDKWCRVGGGRREEERGRRSIIIGFLYSAICFLILIIAWLTADKDSQAIMHPVFPLGSLFRSP
ncbi:hypothetical protein KQX54_003151 [Cotesia glomerata]|uniref:Uncharacterized protein n=1 Tax=Cotesia glomerata TaxID=32391 RepID=A0AAV7I1M3_COTGL|nr:hypothetical protein KQX54_003151 [Cotesia glomerata]